MDLIKRRWRLVALGVAAIILAVAYTQWRVAITRNRSIPDTPFRIAGNLYYVGSTGVTAFLLTGPEGHVLIDGGYPENAPLIVDAIAELGFDITDVRVLLNSHAHRDHAGGLAELQEASGAELWISEGDADVIASGGRGAHSFWPLRVLSYVGLGGFPAARVDHRFQDGQVVQVGPLEITGHVTAGNTRGCTSWSFPVQHGDRELLAVNICSLKLFGFESLVDPETYPGIRADFEASFETLRELPADIFLSTHTNWIDLYAKRREQVHAVDPADPFIDPVGYELFIDSAEARFREMLAEQE